MGLKLGFQVVSWALTLLVIRILSPDDYGLNSISQVFLGFMLGFSNLGLGDALLQRDDDSPHLVASVFGVLLAVSSLLTVGLALAAYPIAAAYGDQRLVGLVQVSSLGFVFNALTTLPRMALTKRMRLKEVMLAELSSGLVGSVSVVALAYAGFGVWALMLGWLASSLARQAAFVAVGRQFYVRPCLDLAAVRPLLSFGAYSTLEYTAWVAMTSADVLIVGRVLGAPALGLYAVVLNFAAMPVSKMAPIVNSIAFPAFAMVQGEIASARVYALKAIRLMAVLTVPAFLGIAATAPEIVSIVFGPSWAAARPLLPVLSAALVFRALLILLPNFLAGIGDAKAGFWCTGLGAAAFPAAVLVGCRWGVAGVCYAWLVAYPAVFVGEAWIAWRRAGLSFLGVLAAPARPLAAGLAMAAAVAALRHALPAMGDVPRMAILSMAGAVAYVAIVRLAFPALAAEVMGLRGRPVPAAQALEVLP